MAEPSSHHHLPILYLGLLSLDKWVGAREAKLERGQRKGGCF